MRSFGVWVDRLQLMMRGLLTSHPETDVDGILLVDLRSDRALDHEQIRLVLAEALGLLRAAGNGFPELVTDHLRRVVAIDTSLETASPLAQSLNAGFLARDRRDPFRFAGKLVWAATYIRVMRNLPWWRRFGQSKNAREVADRMEDRFRADHPGKAP